MAEERTDERALTRVDFDRVTRVTTRWSDNDMYGHLNNAVCQELFDTAINAWLISVEGDVMAAAELGVVAESGCRFFGELAYPSDLDIGVRVARLGRTSITYGLGVFEANREQIAAAGHWVHVYIDRHSRRPAPIPATTRALMESAVEARS